VTALVPAPAVEELERQLAESVAWGLAREATLDGLRQQIATELAGIDVDGFLGNEAAMQRRRARLVELRHAVEVVQRDWPPCKRPGEARP
jgi:hypothetical protein